MTPARENMLRRSVTHALSGCGRRKADFTSNALVWRCRLADQRQRLPFLTHTHMARERMAKNRSMTREHLARLAQLGLIQVRPYRKGHGIVWYPRWGQISRFWQINGLCRSVPDGEPITTLEDWEARRRSRNAAQRARREEEAQRRRESNQAARADAMPFSEALKRGLIPDLDKLKATNRVQGDPAPRERKTPDQIKSELAQAKAILLGWDERPPP